MIELVSPTIYWLSYVGDILCSFTFKFLNQTLEQFVSLFDLYDNYFIFETFNIIVTLFS